MDYFEIAKVVFMRQTFYLGSSQIRISSLQRGATQFKLVTLTLTIYLKEILVDLKWSIFTTLFLQ